MSAESFLPIHSFYFYRGINRNNVNIYDYTQIVKLTINRQKTKQTTNKQTQNIGEVCEALLDRGGTLDLNIGIGPVIKRTMISLTMAGTLSKCQ